MQRGRALPPAQVERRVDGTFKFAELAVAPTRSSAQAQAWPHGECRHRAFEAARRGRPATGSPKPLTGTFEHSSIWSSYRWQQLLHIVAAAHESRDSQSWFFRARSYFVDWIGSDEGGTSRHWHETIYISGSFEGPSSWTWRLFA